MLQNLSEWTQDKNREVCLSVHSIVCVSVFDGACQSLTVYTICFRIWLSGFRTRKRWRLWT